MTATVEVVDDPIIVSWSEIDCFRQCPHKHMISYRERWSEPSVSTPLRRGNTFHHVAELHYNQLMKIGVRPRTAKAMKSVVAEIETYLNLRGSDSPDEIQELIAWMWGGYLEMWGLDTDWEILAVEWKGFAPLPNPWGGPSRFMLKIKADLIVRWKGRIWIVDHKTGRDLPSDKELDLDDQFGLYTWTLRQVGHPVMGAIHNAARTQRNKSPMELDARFSRTPLTRTDTELDMIAREAYQTCEKMWPVEFDAMVQPERTPNTDTCRWKCSFTEACLMGRKGGRTVDMLKAHGCQQSPFREVELEWAKHKETM